MNKVNTYQVGQELFRDVAKLSVRTLCQKIDGILYK